jgi:hypothetical protein
MDLQRRLQPREHVDCTWLVLPEGFGVQSSKLAPRILLASLIPLDATSLDPAEYV